jgi:hypothetical protein
MDPNTDPKTDPQNPAPTDGNTPPATDPKGKGTATDGDEVVTLKKSDYNKLVSQRDRNAEQLRQNSAQDAFVMELAVERTINKFLTENKDKFPDLTAEDLMNVDDPDELDAVATRIQNNISKKVQEKLESVQIKETPKLSEQERAEKLDNLRKEKGNRFGAFLKIKRS